VWNDYKEVEGLVAGRKIRPDGYLAAGASGTEWAAGAKGVAYLYHGNRWHGFPPGHSRFDSVFTFRSQRTGATRELKASDLYMKTEAATLEYLKSGYAVVEVWEHDFINYERRGGSLGGIVRRRMPSGPA
jgi:hypothetical protein